MEGNTMRNLLIAKLYNSFSAGVTDRHRLGEKIGERVDVTSGDMRNKFYNFLRQNHFDEDAAERLANQYSDPALHLHPNNPLMQRKAYLHFAKNIPMMSKDENGRVFQSTDVWIPGLKGRLPDFEINNKGFIAPENVQQKQQIRANVLDQMGALNPVVEPKSTGLGTAGALGLGALGAGLLAGGGYYLYNKWKNRDNMDDDYEFDEDEVEDYYAGRR
jgi:hypothetical protein